MIALAFPALADDKPVAATGLAATGTAAQRALASSDDPDATFKLGEDYMLGRGVAQNLDTAEALLAKAASQGSARAADTYGLLLFQRGDHPHAIPYLETAARRGDARAQYLLGLAHFNGDAVARDWVRGYALVTLAERQGYDHARSALAQMDQYLSPEQRRQAVQLAGTLASEPAVQIARSAAIRPQAMQTGPWRIQLGTFRVAANADALWTKVRGRPELAGHPRIATHGEGAMALQAGGFASSAAAHDACRKLGAAGFDCLVTR